MPHNAALSRRWLPRTNMVFLVTTILTSVTGFFFPFAAITPAMVTGILSVDGYQVRHFATPAEALTTEINDGQLQLLMLDSKGKDACRLAHQLYEKNPKMKALFLAADTPASLLAEFPPKSVAHLPKPFALSTLLRAVRGLLDQRPPTAG